MEVALFGGKIPKGIQMMLVNMIKEAAPELTEHVDSIANLVREFNAKLDRVLAQQEEILLNMRNHDATLIAILEVQYGDRSANDTAERNGTAESTRRAAVD